MIKKGYIYLMKSLDDKERTFITFEYGNGTYTRFTIVLKTGKPYKPVIDAFHGELADKFVRGKNYDNEKTSKAMVEYFEGYLGFFKERLEVLYEEFEGLDGFKYGREILTGLVFPIGDEKSLKHSTLFHDRVFDKVKHRCYLKVTKKYYFEIDSMHKIGAFISGDTMNIIDGSNIADNHDIENYNSIGSDIADNRDIENYNSIKDTFFSRNRTKFINKINDLYNTNVYKCEVFEKKVIKQESKVKQSNETIIMERIEYLLTILEDLDKDLFNKYREKYNNLLNDEDDLLKLDGLNSTTLMLLESEIELEITYKKRNVNNLNDYINSLRIDYLKKLNGEEITNISLKDLDRLYELFIKIKNNYSIGDQREFIKNISFLYLMEIYENKEDIDIDKLNNSYCIDIIRSILINLKSLINIGLFENNIELELNNDINIEMLFNIIKSLKIKDKEQVKVLIR